MSFSKFNEAEINRFPLRYQMEYREKLQNAITRYLAWMNINAQGQRFITRFHHWCHGESGRKRVMELQHALRDSENLFFDIVKLAGATIVKSGITQHSFKRYFFEEMSGKKVVDANTKISDGDFFQLKNSTISQEFNSKSMQHPRKFSFLGLTEGTQVFCKHLESDTQNDYAASYSP